MKNETIGNGTTHDFAAKRIRDFAATIRALDTCVDDLIHAERDFADVVVKVRQIQEEHRAMIEHAKETPL